MNSGALVQKRLRITDVVNTLSFLCVLLIKTKLGSILMPFISVWIPHGDLIDTSVFPLDKQQGKYHLA